MDFDTVHSPMEFWTEQRMNVAVDEEDQSVAVESNHNVPMASNDNAANGSVAASDEESDADSGSNGNSVIFY